MASTKPTASVLARRRRGVMSLVVKGKAQSVLISDPFDVSYLTGFTGEDSMAVLSRGRCVLLTDGRYDEQAAGEVDAGVEVVVRRGPMSTAVAERLKGVRTLAVQSEHLTLALSDAIGSAIGKVKLVEARELTAGLRQAKDETEIAAIRRSARIAQKAFRELTGRGAAYFVGRTERQIAADLEYLMRTHGAQGPSFNTIVAAGANASMPHYRPGPRKIRRDEAVLIDWGALADGYCSDLTRVVFTGRIPPQIAEMYEIVLSAQTAGIAAIRPGVQCSTVDGAARAVIESTGRGGQFTHSLGHGLGRQIHEGPALARTVRQRLRSGIVVTVEPGLYVPGVGGVRIEDDVLVTPDGCRKLTSLPTAIHSMRLKG